MRSGVWCLATVLAACGRGGGDPDGNLDGAGAADAAPDAGPTRAYWLASTGLQLRLDDGLQLGQADLATDVDVTAVHQDFYGVPWDAFLADAEPPAAWVADIDAIAADAEAIGKPVFLSLSPTYGGDRHKLAATVIVEGGGYATDENWKPACYDLRTEPDGAA